MTHNMKTWAEGWGSGWAAGYRHGVEQSRQALNGIAEFPMDDQRRAFAHELIAVFALVMDRLDDQPDDPNA